jgi:mannosyltransferase OCH1-like enzyme
MRKKNPAYDYQFYDDARIENFLKEEFEPEIYDIYKKINIGAAKADFFRYAILYKKGGVYLDIDSLFFKKLDDIILPDDHAIITLEGNLELYAQFALFFEAGHPFLKKTIEMAVENLKANKYPHNVHKMTGPTVFTSAVRECISENHAIQYRQMGVDYNGLVKFSYPMSKTFLYGFSRKNHWKKQMKTKSILGDDHS